MWYIIYIGGVFGLSTEILRIIEAGIKNDSNKVINYAYHLANSVEKSGDSKFAEKIRKVISENNTRVATLDRLTSKPLDREGKMDMVDITIPYSNETPLFFDSIIEDEIETFIMTYLKKDELEARGIDCTNNLLLYGPPGTGKTSLAKYISFQTNLPLLTVRMDALISSLLGNTAKNIRKVFDYAASQKCVLFLDEFDVIAKLRNDKSEIGELKRVVNSLIQNIDNFSDDCILIAATNHADLLDTAIWRRFNKIIELEFPECQIRRQLIEEYSRILENDYMRDSKKVDILVSLTEFLSPAVIKNIINNAAKRTLLNGGELMSYSDLIKEIYLYTDKKPTEKGLVKFLHEAGISQKEISEISQLSLRKVREFIKEM